MRRLSRRRYAAELYFHGACADKLLLILFWLGKVEKVEKIDGYFEWHSKAETANVNKLPARASFDSFASASAALSMKRENSRFLSLDGQWRFRLFRDYPTSRRCIGFAHPSFASGSWEAVELPHSFAAEEKPNKSSLAGEEEPIPPFAPQFGNPVGIYIKKFRLPADWADKRVTLCMGGAGSAYYVYVNGEKAAYAESSRDFAEFDITDFVTAGVNTLALEVYCFSTGSWLEFESAAAGGIFRKPYLRITEKAYISDIDISAEPTEDFRDGTVTLTIKTEGVTEDAKLEAEIFDGDEPVGFASAYVSAYEDTVLKTTVAGISLWENESPKLYKVLVSLYCEGKACEFTAFEAGFRKIEISGASLLINGKKTVLKGASGWRISEAAHGADIAEMKKAVSAMKNCGMNAFFSSGGPCHPMWYALCDEAGIYVIDECNISAYPGKNCSPRIAAALPGRSPMWEEACLDRAQSLYERDKNHPSVIMWSLGGIPAGETAEKLASVFGGEIVCRRGEDTDYFSGVSLASSEDYDFSQSEKPVIFYDLSPEKCGEIYEEYSEAHAFCGAFTGEAHGIGALAGESFSADNDNYSAVVYGDFSPAPECYTLKRKFQNVVFTDIDAEHGVIGIENKYIRTDLSSFTLHWRQTCRGELLREGSENFPLAPGENGTLDLELNRLTGDEWYLDLAFEEKGTHWAEASAQFIVNPGCGLPAYAGGAGAVSVREAWNTIIAGGSSFAAEFSRSSGRIFSMRFMGEELLTAPVELNFSRKMTREEKKNFADVAGAVWKKAGETATFEIEDITETAREAVIALRFTAHTYPESRGRLIYTVTSLGIKADLEFTPAPNLPPPGEVGLKFPLVSAFSELEFWGRGNWQNKNSTYADMGVFIQLPSEFIARRACDDSGRRTQVRYIKLLSGKFSLVFEAYPEMNICLEPQKDSDELFLRLSAESADCGTYRLSFAVIPSD